MPDSKPNNPYARPVNATRSEGQMLVGEFYGTRANDKQLAGLRGRQVAPASRFAGRAVAVPVDMDAPKPKPTRKRKATTLNTDATSPSDDNTGVAPAITEDDLFG